MGLQLGRRKAGSAAPFACARSLNFAAAAQDDSLGARDARRAEDVGALNCIIIRPIKRVRSSRPAGWLGAVQARAAWRAPEMRARARVAADGNKFNHIYIREGELASERASAFGASFACAGQRRFAAPVEQAANGLRSRRQLIADSHAAAASTGRRRSLVRSFGRRQLANAIGA